MTERTLAIIKPDAVERRLAGPIIQRIEAEGFTIRALRREIRGGEEKPTKRGQTPPKRAPHRRVPLADGWEALVGSSAAGKKPLRATAS